MQTRLFKQGKNFNCIGSRCIDSCCTGWDITFDVSTYNQLSKDSRYDKIMADYAYINDNTAMPTINYAIVNLTADNRCPFLDGDDLCKLQKENSEAILATVCALYPRYYNIVDSVYEETLSLACIEAAELLLLNSPLELITLTRGPKKDVVLQEIESNNDYSTFKHLHEFRLLIFDFIRNNKHSFEEKLGMLKAFHQELEVTKDERIEPFLSSYDFDNKTTSIGLDEDSYKTIIDCLTQVGLCGLADLDELIADCISNSSYNYLNLDNLTHIDAILSNYLIHQMFKELYPFIQGYNEMDSFYYLLKKVQILRVLIVYDGSFDPKRVVRIIQMFSKGLEHHGGFHYELQNMTL